MKRRNIGIQIKRHHHKGSQVLLISLISLCLLFKADYTYAQTNKIEIQPLDHFKLIWETAKKINANETNMVMVAKSETQVDGSGFTVGARVEVKANPNDNSANAFYGGFIRGYGAEVAVNTDALTQNSSMEVSYKLQKETEAGMPVEDRIFMKINSTGEISNVGYEFKIGNDGSPGRLKFNIVGEPSGKITASAGISYKTNVPVSEVFYPGTPSAMWEGSLNLSGDTQSGNVKVEASSNFSFKPDGKDGVNYFFNTSGSTIFSASGDNTNSQILFSFGFSW